MKRRMNNEGSYGWKTIKGYKYVYYRDPNGKYTYAKSKKELDQKLLKTKEEKQAILDSTYIFSDYCFIWLRSIKQEIEQTTYTSYEDVINYRIVNSSLGNKAVRSITPTIVNNFYLQMANKYARSTIEKTSRVINPTIKFGIKHGLIPEFDFSEIKIPKENSVAIKKKEIQFVSLEEVEKIYQEANRKTNSGSYIYGNAAKIIIFIMYSGLRIGEATGLKWNCVNKEKEEIIVKQSRARILQNEENNLPRYAYIQKSTKSEASNRIIPLPDRALEVLDYFNDLYPNHKPYDNVFLNSNNVPYDFGSIRKCLKRILKNAGLEKNITPHSLRHGYGSILLSKGVDIKIVSKLLGHKDITTTYNIYIGVYKEDEINAVKSVFNYKDEKRGTTD